jgi:hypothetical protein
MPVPDSTFDAVLSSSARLASRVFWTPVEVSKRASQWLEESGAHSVLDIGSGVGKACVVGALSTSVIFHGIEKRSALVEEARKLANDFQVGSRVRLEYGLLRANMCDDHDGMYVFNPFTEWPYQRPGAPAPSALLEREPGVAVFEQLLRRAPPGFRMVTYHGCGARIPDNYALLRAEPAGTNVIRLWKKLESPAEGYWLEQFESIDHWTRDGHPSITS